MHTLSWNINPSPLTVCDRSTARVGGAGWDPCQMWKPTRWSHNKLHAAAPSRVSNLVTPAMEKHHWIREQMFKPSSEGQNGQMFQPTAHTHAPRPSCCSDQDECNYCCLTCFTVRWSQGTEPDPLPALWACLTKQRRESRLTIFFSKSKGCLTPGLLFPQQGEHSDGWLWWES